MTTQNKPKKSKKCCECGARNRTVKRICCGYESDLNGVCKKETICKKCEQAHCQEL